MAKTENQFLFLTLFILSVVAYKSFFYFATLIPCSLILHSRLFAKLPLLDIYHQPGILHGFKYIVLRVLFWLKPRSKLDIRQLERLQPFSNSPQAFDAVFFDGATRDGEYFILGCERHPGGIVNALFYLVTKEEGVLLSEKLPKTELKISSTEEIDYYGAEGIQAVPIEPMSKWLIQYKGKMRSQDNPEKTFDVNFSGFFQSATTNYFSYDTDFSRHAMAFSMAKEPWTLEYLRQMKSAHQCHYEQIGTMDATLELGDTARPRHLGDTARPRHLCFQVFRDHSYGFQRDWTLMHRFTFQILFFENGDALILGNVSQPCTCSELVIGYVYSRGRYYPIRESDFRLYQHGESGQPPLDYAFTVNVESGDDIVGLVVQIEVLQGGVHYVGENGVMKVHERFVKCKMNGLEGRGVSECVYNQAGFKKLAD